MGEGACQLDILDSPSWRRELTSETIPISLGGPLPQVHSEVLNNFFNVWESIGEKTLSTFLHNSCRREHVNLILKTDLAGDVN